MAQKDRYSSSGYPRYLIPYFYDSPPYLPGTWTRYGAAQAIWRSPVLAPKGFGAGVFAPKVSPFTWLSIYPLFWSLKSPPSTYYGAPHVFHDLPCPQEWCGTSRLTARSTSCGRAKYSHGLREPPTCEPFQMGSTSVDVFLVSYNIAGYPH